MGLVTLVITLTLIIPCECGWHLSIRRNIYTRQLLQHRQIIATFGMNQITASYVATQNNRVLMLLLWHRH